MVSLPPGKFLGSFKVSGPLGSGTMGEVYRARDTKLGREVAIKVLPEAFAKDEERLARFEREAKVLASLNHTNIAGIYDFGHENDIHFLVMELAEGDTLEEQLQAGPMSVDQVLSIFSQIGEALDAAHGQGIVHRDLKPANIKVSESGRVKILDFGLAKAFQAQQTAEGGASPGGTLELGSSDSGSITLEGHILGSPAYMSPEQARGQRVDRRTDIWAFGCCLYEALTRRRPFQGQTISDLFAEILKSEPDWNLLPEETPETVRVLLRRCLERDGQKRIKDAGDIAIVLAEARTSAVGAPFGFSSESVDTKMSAAGSPKRSYPWMLLAGVFLIALAGGAWWLSGAKRGDPISETEAPLKAAPKPVRRFSIGLSPEYPLKRPNPIIGDYVIAISPDGTMLVYVSEVDGVNRLISRRLDELEFRVIPGSEGAWSPFFSPDGAWIGYQERDNDPKLMKLQIAGGVPIPLADSELPFGGSWGADDRIIFGRGIGFGIWRVNADGESLEQIVAYDPELGETGAGNPQSIVDRGLFIYGATMMPPHADHAHWYVKFFDSDRRHLFAEDAAVARYVPSGHMIYARTGALFARSFDLDRVVATGPELPVTESRMASSSTVPRNYAFSEDGTLVYVPITSEGEVRRNLAWVDREGNEEPIQAPIRPYSSVRVSPDGNRLVLDLTTFEDVWIHDLVRGTTHRLTFDLANDYRPIWMPDGRRVVFLSSRANETSIYSKRADGIGGVESLVSDSGYPYPEAVTRDGKTLIFRPVASMAPIWRIDLDGEGESELLLGGNFNERNVRISSDGTLISYESNETGRFEIYVQSFPELSAKWQISSGGGQDAIWNPQAAELFYWENDRLMVVDVEMEPTFSAGDPKPLFTMPSKVAYDVAPDGRRFVVIKKAGASAWATELIVVQNWFEELKRLAPATEN